MITDTRNWRRLTAETIADLPEAGAVFEVANLVRTVQFIGSASGNLRARLASYAHVVVRNRRGVGLSDPLPLDQLTTVVSGMDDVLAVLDATAVDWPALLGTCPSSVATWRDRLLLRVPFSRHFSVAASIPPMLEGSTEGFERRTLSCEARGNTAAQTSTPRVAGSR